MIQARLQGEFLRDQLEEFNDEDYSNIPTELQDAGVLVDDIDLGVGKDQPHDTMTGSQDNSILGFDFHLDH